MICQIRQSRDVKPKTNKTKKVRVEILGDSMLHGIQEKGLNKNTNIIIKIWEYPGASTTNILDHIKPNLRKEPDQIVINAGIHNPTNYHNYLKLVSAIFKQIFIYHQVMALQKLWKMVFISSKKLFLFSRYLFFRVSIFPSFYPCQPLL